MNTSSAIDFSRALAMLESVAWLQTANRTIQINSDPAVRDEFLSTYKMIIDSMDSMSPRLMRRAVQGSLTTHLDSRLLLGALLAVGREVVATGQFTIASIYPKLPKVRAAFKAHPQWPMQFVGALKMEGADNPFFQQRLQTAMEDLQRMLGQSGLHGVVEVDNAPEGGAGGSGAPPDGGAEGGPSGGLGGSSGAEGWGEEDVWGLPFWCLAVLAGISAFFP